MRSIDKYHSYLENKTKIKELKSVLNKIDKINLEFSKTTTFNQYLLFYVMVSIGLFSLLLIANEYFSSIILPFYFVALTIILAISFFFCNNKNEFEEFRLLFLKIKETNEKLFELANKKEIYQDKINIVLDYINLLEQYDLRLKKSFNLSDINELSKIKNLSIDQRKVIISLADYLSITLKDINPVLIRENNEVKNNEFMNELVSFTDNYNHDKSFDENIEAIKALVDNHNINKNKITTV